MPRANKTTKNSNATPNSTAEDEATKAIQVAEVMLKTKKTKAITTTKKKTKPARKITHKSPSATSQITLRAKSRGEMRFALYLRKSTEEDERQVNSIEDQEKICREFADRQGDINIVTTYKEQKSAAYANNREQFSEMVSMIEDGKLDGIIAYHPDRLSRNMLEAGKVLDMLKPNKGETVPALQALVFPTVSFNNDSGGRLMLAVLFSMATQYSEHLSEQVLRGVNSNLAKGISSGTPKWGYQRNEVTGLYEPDKNFDIIKQGWKKILSGESQAQILEFWKEKGVFYETKAAPNKPPRKIYIKHKKTVSTLFRDPIYMGVLCQKGQEVNLIELGVDFEPMITEQEYNRVQALLSSNPQAHRAHKGTNEFTMFRGCVFCSECGSRLQGYLGGHSKDHRFVYYGHRNKTEASKNCPRQTTTTYIEEAEAGGNVKKVKVSKEIRAKVILDALYEVLDTLKPTKADYAKYLAVASQYSEEKADELRVERRSLSGKLTQLKATLNRENQSYKALIETPNAPQVTKDSTAKQITALEAEIVDTEDRIAQLNILLKKPEQAVMAEKEFLNLLKTAAEQMRTRDMAGKDILFRKIFLNARIDKQNRVIFLCKPEFNGLIKHSSVTAGGDMWT